MATYNITAEFSITTEIEADFRGLGLDADYEDNSYWQSNSVDSDGGSITFKVEATDEDDAARRAEEVIDSGMEIEDANGLTWMIENVNYEIEADEVPMDKARAVELIEAYLTASDLPEETKAAFEFVLAYVMGMTT